MLGADVFPVDIDALRCQPLQRIKRLLLLVVEATVEAQLLGDELELGIRSNRSDNLESLLLGDLADDLAHSTSRRADEDGLALLGLADLVESSVGRQTGHTEGTEEVGQLEVVRVVDLPDALHHLLGDADVLGEGKVAEDGLALLEVWVVGLEHLGDGVVHDGRVEVEGGCVGRGAGFTHLAAEVRVVRGVADLDNQAAGWCCLIEVNWSVLDDDVLARHGCAGGHLLEDESLVLCHDEGCGGLMFR